MTQLTKKNVADLNNMSPGSRRAGLGTIARKMNSLANIYVEPMVGKVNTNFAVIDTCDAKNMDTNSSAANFTNALSTAKYRNGTGSNLLQSLTTNATLTHSVKRTIGSVDWSGSDLFGFWAFSDVALAAGDVKMSITATTGGAQTIDLPAIVPGVWQWVELAKGAVTCADVIGYGFIRAVAKVFSLYVDKIIRYKVAETSVLAQTPVETQYTDTGIVTHSPKIVAGPSAAAGANTPEVYAEGTEYMVAPSSKRIIWMTDEHLNTGFVMYAA